MYIKDKTHTRMCSPAFYSREMMTNHRRDSIVFPGLDDDALLIDWWDAHPVPNLATKSWCLSHNSIFYPFGDSWVKCFDLIVCVECVDPTRSCPFFGDQQASLLRFLFFVSAESQKYSLQPVR